jgi:hypothetical protein
VDAVRAAGQGHVEPAIEEQPLAVGVADLGQRRPERRQRPAPHGLLAQLHRHAPGRNSTQEAVEVRGQIWHQGPVRDQVDNGEAHG